MYRSVSRRGHRVHPSRWQGVCWTLFCCSLALPLGHAGEPAQEFLSQLRAAGHFELAIAYLDRLDSYPGVSAQFSSSVLLEKAQTYIDAGVAARNADDQADSFRQAEEQLQAFLSLGSHPRHSQARMQLGRLQMVRAAQLEETAKDAEGQTAARQSYLSAAKTFDTIVANLRETLKEMQGAKIDASEDPERFAQRDEFRAQFLTGIKNAGEARLLAAQTFENPGEQGKPILEEALETFTELSDKYEDYVPGAVALAYRGEVQAELGQREPALDSFIRMLEQPDVEGLREAKFRAATGMIRVYLNSQPPAYQLAIDAVAELSQEIRPNEQALPIVQRFRLVLADAHLAKAADDQNQEPPAIRRAQSAARELLKEAIKFPGSTGDEARERLAKMGIATTVEESDAPPVSAVPPTDLADAIAKARQWLAKITDLNSTRDLLTQQAGEGDTSEQQLAAIDQELGQTRANAISVLRAGLGMANQNTDPGSLNEARQLLAYMLYQNREYRGAAVVGHYLARAATGADIGLQGGLLALNSLQSLLAEDADNRGLAEQLQQLGEYLTTTWPDNPKAAAAQDSILKLALKAGQYDKAQTLIDQMPNGPDKSAALLLMGRILWGDSFQYRSEGQSSQSEQAITAAEKSLRTGLEMIEGKLVGPDVMKASLALTKIYLLQDDVARAAEVLEHPIYGPLPLAESQGSPDQSFASDLYGTQLRVIVQQMTKTDADPSTALDLAATVMEKLRQSADGPDASKRLTAIYVSMARDIRDQLDRSDLARKGKLVDAFRLFLDRIASTTSDPNTLQWTATTLIELAESSAGPGQPLAKATGQTAELLDTAVKTLQRLQTETDQPSLTIDYQLARAHRMLGNYKSSIDLLDGILQQKPNMLDAQLEAAKAYEQWAADVPPKFAGRAYRTALNGGRPNGQGENVIWGWGKISLQTMRNPKFKATFYDARYHVALCRFLWGKADNDQRIIEKSVTDITRLQALHPDLGGDQQFQKFDALLKTIQQQLGQPVVGLAR